MFIVRDKSVKQDGTAPAIQYGLCFEYRSSPSSLNHLTGYGGFSIPISPSFSPTILTFIKAYGAIYAIANIRGGGEFGEEWHEAGIRDKKVNVFDDFIAAS
jgi:prolyl oligopeptidase